MRDLDRLGTMIDHLLAEATRLRRENEALTQQVIFKRPEEPDEKALKLALKIIRDGSVPGGKTMVEQGSWKAFSRALQDIAAEVLPA